MIRMLTGLAMVGAAVAASRKRHSVPRGELIEVHYGEMTQFPTETFYVDDWVSTEQSPTANYKRTYFQKSLGRARSSALRVAQVLKQNGFNARVIRADR